MVGDVRRLYRANAHIKTADNLLTLPLSPALALSVLQNVSAAFECAGELSGEAEKEAKWVQDVINKYQGAHTVFARQNAVVVANEEFSCVRVDESRLRGLLSCVKTAVFEAGKVIEC